MRWLTLPLVLAGLVNSAVNSAVNPAWAYVDNAPTLGQLVNSATTVSVLRVDKVSLDKRVVIFKKVADLKGKETLEEFKHQINDGVHQRSLRTILDWAEDARQSGRMAICFRNDKVAQICLGTFWYECALGQDAWWSMTDAKPERSLAYYGSTERLRSHVEAMLSGKQAVLTCLPHGQNGFGAYFQMAFRTPPGSKDFPVQRVRASLGMPAVVYQIEKDARFFVGLGGGEAKDVAPLLEALKHAQPRVRAAAAEELGLIGPNAMDARAALAEALADNDPAVRLSAAGALALIDPAHKALTPALVRSLAKGAVRERQMAAEIIGQVGPDATAAIPLLIDALKNKDLCGPAAGALGGIGPKASAAVPALVELLKDKDAQNRVSAAVALARIGGPGTQPAVPVIMDRWHKGDGYDASLYIAALGPEAKETTPFLLANLNYFTAWTLWSVEPRAAIPHLHHCDIANDASYRHSWSSAYFRMVGPRTKDMAEALAEGLRDGKVPPVASWATNLLRREAKATAPIFALGLKNKDAAIRVRSVTLLGDLGPAAIDAVAVVQGALKDENEQVRQAAAQALKKIQAK